MKKVILMILFGFISIAFTKAQKLDKNHRLSFYDLSVYYGNGSNNKGENSSSIGNTLGVLANINPSYNNYKDTDPFILGWSLNAAVAWNFNAQKPARDNIDIGIWMSKLINQQIEFGLQYSFLGRYGYQNVAFFGSGIQTAMRVTDFQLTYSREGEGAFIGCIKSKTSGFNTNSVGLKYFFKEKLFIGSKLLAYKNTKEYLLAVGLTSF